MGDPRDFVHYAVILRELTDEAALLQDVDSGEAEWFPLSTIDDEKPVRSDIGEEINVYIVQWIVEKKGWYPK